MGTDLGTRNDGRVGQKQARFFKQDARANVKDELDFHLASKIEDLRAEGWNEGDARLEAERQFGDVQAVEKIGLRIGGRMEQRKKVSDHWVDLLQDLRYTMRT